MMGRDWKSATDTFIPRPAKPPAGWIVWPRVPRFVMRIPHETVPTFVPLLHQRARLGRMFNHGPMRNAAFTPKDKRNRTQLEQELIDVITAFEQLQKDRQRANYDSGWKLVETDVRNSVTLRRGCVHEMAQDSRRGHSPSPFAFHVWREMGIIRNSLVRLQSTLQAPAAMPCFSTRDRSLSAGPEGRFSPRSIC